MSMDIVIAAYIVVGVFEFFFGFVGRLFRQIIKEELSDFGIQEDLRGIRCGLSRSKTHVSKPRSLLATIVIFLICVAVYPFFYVLLILDLIEERKFRHKMGGTVGYISCQDCHHSGKITSRSIRKSGIDIGMDCYSCGQFCNANSLIEASTCSDGSALLNKDEIFCPVCKSKNIKFTFISRI